MNQKIKLIHVIGKLQYGGAERLLLDICRKIDKDKFEIQVVSLKDRGELFEKFEEAGIKVTFFPKRSKLDQKLVKELKEFFLEEQPDIVHTHLFMGDYYGGKAALKANVPFIVSTKHDILPEDFIRTFLGRRLRRKFNKVIAISKATQEFLLKEEKISLKKVSLIYNGVDVEKFYLPERKILKQDVINIGSVGRFVKEKGHKHLVRSCRLLKVRNWFLTLVGDGPLRNYLESLVRKLGIEEKVKITGGVDEVKVFLENIDIFVLPSSSEGLSLSIMEAALAGCFVIATKVGGIPEVITNKKTGLLFNSKSIEQLVNNINWVVDNPGEARKMAKLLQEEVKVKFAINKTVLEYQSLYESFINK